MGKDAKTNGIVFFSLFFVRRNADLRDYFSNLPLYLSFFVPALTMKLFAEERKSGSMETLILPSNWNTVNVIEMKNMFNGCKDLNQDWFTPYGGASGEHGVASFAFIMVK